MKINRDLLELQLGFETFLLFFDFYVELGTHMASCAKPTSEKYMKFISGVRSAKNKLSFKMSRFQGRIN